MHLRFDTRESDSPWVRGVWTCTSERVTEMTSTAAVSWGLVFWQQHGHSDASVTGPETGVRTAPVPEGATFTGIDFAVGTSLRALPTSTLLNGGLDLPDTTDRFFRLDGSRWETPGPDDAEALVNRLIRAGAIVRDPLVAEVRRGGHPGVTPRTLERRFRAATGFAQGTLRQIERVTSASSLLAAGSPVADVVTDLGYFDEPHLARALRRFIGRTPRQLRNGTGGAISLDLDQPVLVQP
ncbi:helix-turn-helix domain-containing protein [Actinoplanes bogorensis]|uniref:Helix-turn-helix domain-containing protein n=1 Tax=Paractinoplanes bogorensis TaxID=1610840 RepID=A0ABS5YWI9_9ACTN|nr:helix-turn-helix domain-containing protein [Actinoplanes bogorensis]MBU2667812.1 helix-turn-helix domain-containing protein [Actinoplanes bogorensis]